MRLAFIAILSISMPASLIAQPETRGQMQEQHAQPQAQLQSPVDLTKFAFGDETKSDLDKVICREQYELGSRLIHNKVCLTRGQWREYEAENREHVQEMERIGLQGN